MRILIIMLMCIIFSFVGTGCDDKYNDQPETENDGVDP